MTSRRIVASLLASALLLAPAPPAAAGDLGSFIGGIVAGVFGRPFVERAGNRRAAPRASQRDENRRVQAALNYFGFPAGAIDGTLGPKSRAAIGEYQAFMGDPATGVLSEYELAFLSASYDRAMAGGPEVADIVPISGPRGLLLAFREEQARLASGQPIPPAPVAEAARAD